MQLKQFIEVPNYKIGFVKKPVSHTQWDNWYSKNNIYCKLYENTDGVWIAFLASTPSPDCRELTFDDKVQLHQYREIQHIKPAVFEDNIELKNGMMVKKEKKSFSKGLEKLGEWVRRQVWYKPTS